MPELIPSTREAARRIGVTATALSTGAHAPYPSPPHNP